MYGKIFEEIFNSTIIKHGRDVLYVFMSMIILSDKDGFIRSSIPALANRILMDQKKVNECIEILLQPDPESNNKDHDGRRIVLISEVTDGIENRGWFVVNKEFYKEKSSRFDKKENTRDRVRRFRERNTNVTQSNALKPNETLSSAHTDTDTDTDNNKIYVEKSNSRRTTSDQKEMAKEILSFLNAKAKRNYRPVDANLDLILARIKSGVELQDFKSVIAKKCREWLTDPKMHNYLRPATLFNKTKFEQYLGELYQEEEHGS